MRFPSRRRHRPIDDAPTPETAATNEPTPAETAATGEDDRPPRKLPRRALRVGLAALAVAVPGSMVAGTTAMMMRPAGQSGGPDLGGFLPTQVEDAALDPFLDPELLAAVPVGPEDVSEDVEGVLGGSEVVDTLGQSGIPEVALDAYMEAADQLEVDDPGCGIRWTLLAAIGRVESNHGRFGGAQLRDDGYGTRPIRGIPLDGRPNVAEIRDTDNGELDGDTTYDRAVGPMQFIPSTWSSVGVDADGDGRSDPNNIFDAAQGAAVYLCRGDADLRNVDQRAGAVRRYNNADEYVRVVLNLAEMYESGDVEEIPSVGLPPREPTPPPRPSPGPPRTPGSTTPAPQPPSPPRTTPRPPATAPPRPPATTTSTTRPPTTSTSTTVPAPSSITTSTSTTVPTPSTTTTTVPSTTTIPAEAPETAAIGWAPAMREVVVQILEQPAPAPEDAT